MPDDKQDNQWNRLVGAAREAKATDDPAPEEKAPSAFVAGVISMRKGLWLFAKTVLWRRWSLAAALLAIALYLTFYLIMKSHPPAPAPEPEPVPTLPLPPEP